MTWDLSTRGAREDVPVFRYVIRAEGEYGVFLVASDGMLAITSSCKNYSFRWSAPGPCIRRFLAECGADYIEKNLAFQFQTLSARQRGELRAFMSRLWPTFRQTLQGELAREAQG